MKRPFFAFALHVALLMLLSAAGLWYCLQAFTAAPILAVRPTAPPLARLSLQSTNTQQLTLSLDTGGAPVSEVTATITIPNGMSAQNPQLGTNCSPSSPRPVLLDNKLSIRCLISADAARTQLLTVATVNYHTSSSGTYLLTLESSSAQFMLPQPRFPVVVP